ncbi:MAG TPA: TIGR03435 family protein [Vicinamibacterales bacterium]|nr:TIGR03435 family protein [Vicinamibacterales bacterium]
MGRTIGILFVSGFVLGTSLAVIGKGQTDQKPLAFEVASVKVNPSGEVTGTLQMRPGGYFRAVNFDIFNLVAFAFRTESRNLFPTQIAGLPEWASSARYDIDAKINHELFDATAGDPLRRPKAVRSLLEDRFKLRTHVARREQPMYNLVVLKPGQLGPQMHVSTADCDKDQSTCGFIRSLGGRHFRAESITIETLAGLFQGTVGRVVVDRTGLHGYFNLEIEWTEDENATDKVSIFTAIQEQLGLKLQSTNGPIDVLVIDHVERPSTD